MNIMFAQVKFSATVDGSGVSYFSSPENKKILKNHQIV